MLITSSTLTVLAAFVLTGYMVYGPPQILKYSSYRSFYDPNDPAHLKYNPHFFVSTSDFMNSQDAQNDFWLNQSRRPHGTFGPNDVPPDTRNQY